MPPLAYLKTSGGIFHDSTIHDIDMITWILGYGFVRCPDRRGRERERERESVLEIQIRKRERGGEKKRLEGERCKERTKWRVRERGRERREKEIK